MRLLVTGASGFVGRHVVALLRDLGEDVVAWGLSDGSEGCQVSVDLSDARAPKRHDLRGIDAVIHLAALAQVSGSYLDPALYVSANASMEINLIEEFLRQRCFPKVLVVSTGGVYKGMAGVSITEESAIEPNNPYVISKLTQEMLGSYYGHRGFDVVIARPFNHIGPGQQRGYLVPDVASQMAALERSQGGELTVGNITSARDYTDVRDVAAAYYALVRKGRPGEIYNVCSGRSHTGEEIVARLLKLARKPVEVTRDPALNRPTDTASVSASNAKIRRETGWEPLIPLDQTLADVLDHWRALA